MASEKIVGFRRSLLSALCDSVAADSTAYRKYQQSVDVIKRQTLQLLAKCWRLTFYPYPLSSNP